MSEQKHIFLIDSMPVMTAHARRSSRAKVAREIKGKGYDAVKERQYCGLKLHILAVRRNRRLPPPDYIGITPASTADINVLKDISDDLHDTSVYADKAYVSKALKQFLEEQNTVLNTPVKKNKGQQLDITDEIISANISRIRRQTESLLNWIDEKNGIQTASKARSTQELLVHV